jgi:FixJ family two-component response regulator
MTSTRSATLTPREVQVLQGLVQFPDGEGRQR